MEAATCSGWSVILVVTAIISATHSIPLNQFVSFGPRAGDSSLRPGSSLIASPGIAIPPGLPFFNGTYGKIHVSIVYSGTSQPTNTTVGVWSHISFFAGQFEWIPLK